MNLALRFYFCSFLEILPVLLELLCFKFIHFRSAAHLRSLISVVSVPVSFLFDEIYVSEPRV